MVNYNTPYTSTVYTDVKLELLRCGVEVTLSLCLSITICRCVEEMEVKNHTS